MSDHLQEKSENRLCQTAHKRFFDDFVYNCEPSRSFLLSTTDEVIFRGSYYVRTATFVQKVGLAIWDVSAARILRRQRTVDGCRMNRKAENAQNVFSKLNSGCNDNPGRSPPSFLDGH